MEAMIVNCEACQKRYFVEEAVLGVSGRTLKCAACHHRWHQAPPSPENNPVETLAKKASSAGGTPSKSWVSLSVMLFSLALVSGVGGYFARYHVAATWPATAKLYALLGLETGSDSLSHLILKAVSPLEVSKTCTEKIIVIRGEILNQSDTVEPLKFLNIRVEGPCTDAPFFERLFAKTKRLWSKEPASCTMGSWRHYLTATRLLPGEKIAFETAPQALPLSSYKILIDF